VLDLGAGDARRDEDQNGDENRSNGQAAKPDGPGHRTGSFHLVHWQLTSVNCAPTINTYSSAAASARAPQSFAMQGLSQDKSYPIREASKSRQLGPIAGSRGAESARITVIGPG
jgi:hypothetical protein